MLGRLREKLQARIWIPALMTRISIGWMFARGGWGKLQNLPDVTEYFASLHLPYPQLFAPSIGAIELVCGGLICIGLFTRLAALPLIATMIGAIMTAKLEDIGGAADLFGTSEFLLGLGLLWLVFTGPLCFSVDQRFGLERKVH